MAAADDDARGGGERMNFVALWCEHFGLSADTTAALRRHGCSGGESLATLTPDRLGTLDIRASELCLLRGSLLQYAQAHDVVNKAIWRRLLSDNAATGGGGGRRKKQTQKFRKVRHVEQFLETFQGHHDVTDVENIMARFAEQSELRKRLHKKRQAPTDDGTLAERILRQREALEEERSASAPPDDMKRVTSSASLNSVKSSPAAPTASSSDVIHQPPPSNYVIPRRNDVIQRASPPNDVGPPVREPAPNDYVIPRRKDVIQRASPPNNAGSRSDDVIRRPAPSDYVIPRRSDVIERTTQSDDVIPTRNDAHAGKTAASGVGSGGDILQTIQNFQDNLFTPEELELIASLNDTPHRGERDSGEEAALDKIINGDFNREMDRYLRA